MRQFKQYDTSLGTQYHTQASKLLERDYWLVTEPFVYTLASGYYVTVPTGFLTDGASIPKALWNMIPPWGDHGQAAVMHDYLCEHGSISNGYNRISVDRRFTDKAFVEGLTALNVSPIKVKMMATGVNLYRKVTRPVTPNKETFKDAIEKMIMSQYARTGSFVLTEAQIASLNLTKQLGRQS